VPLYSHTRAHAHVTPQWQLLAPPDAAGEAASIQLKPALAIPLEHSELTFSLLLVKRAVSITRKIMQKGELKTQGASCPVSHQRWLPTSLFRAAVTQCEVKLVLKIDWEVGKRR